MVYNCDHVLGDTEIGSSPNDTNGGKECVLFGDSGFHWLQIWAATSSLYNFWPIDPFSQYGHNDLQVF